MDYKVWFSFVKVASLKFPRFGLLTLVETFTSGPETKLIQYIKGNYNKLKYDYYGYSYIK